MSDGHNGVYKWSSIDRIGNSVITFAGNIILARLLTPFDFGLVAIVGIFISIAYNVSGCGLSDGLIHKLAPTKRDYSTVFVFNAVMGLLFCSFFIGISYPVASFFGHEELVGIMWALGICFFFSTLTFTQETKLRKELDMKSIAIVKLLSALVAVGLGIVLALSGYGYWALVSSRIFLSFFQFVFYLIVSRWMPRIAFYRDSFKELFGYGVHLMVSYVFTQIGRNINTFILGKYSPVASGIYSQAQKMEEVPYSILESVFNWPFFAVLSNEKEEAKRRELSRNMFCNILWLSVTIGVMLVLLSSPGFGFLFGEKWMAAVPVFRLLIIFGIFTSIKYFFQTILKVYGETKRIRNLTIIELVLQLVLLAVSYTYGILMIALSQIIAVSVVLVMYIISYKRIEGSRYGEILYDAVKVISIPFIVFIVVAVGYYFWHSVVGDIVDILLILVTFSVVFVMINEKVRPEVYMNYRSKILKSRRK